MTFGLVSQLVDVPNEGAKSVLGPYLTIFGDGATLLGIMWGAMRAGRRRMISVLIIPKQYPLLVHHVDLA